MEQAGLELKKIVFDSDPSNIWASEQYKKDIALTEPGSYMINKKSSLFSKDDLQSFNLITEKANPDKQGDHAALYLYKP